MKNLFTLFLAVLCFQGFSQTPLANLADIRQVTGGGFSGSFLYGYNLATDPENNLIIGGHYNNYGPLPLVYQGDTLLSDLTASAEIVLFKLDAADGHLLWLKRIESSSDLTLFALAVDQAGAIILRFYCYESSSFPPVDFEPGLTLLKIGPDGDYAWHQSLKGLYSYQGNRMLTLDCSDNIITGGNTSYHNTDVVLDTLIMTPDTFFIYEQAPDTIFVDGGIYPPAGADNLAVLKFQPDGSLAWLKEFPARAYMADISAEFGSDIAFCGLLYDDSLYLDNVLLVQNDTAENVEFFHAKIDGDGNAKWSGIYFADAYAWDIRTAPDGAVYAASEFYESTSYQNTVIQSQGIQDMLVFRLDSFGVFEWAHGVGDEYTNQVGSLCVNRQGEVVLSGYSLKNNELARKYAPQGNLLWTLPEGGGLGNNRSGPVVFDTDGALWVSATYNGDFEIGPYEFSIWGGPSYALLAKFTGQSAPGSQNSCPDESATNVHSLADNPSVRIFPNPTTSSIEISTPEPLSAIRILSANGSLLAVVAPPAGPVVRLDLPGNGPGLFYLE